MRPNKQINKHKKKEAKTQMLQGGLFTSNFDLFFETKDNSGRVKNECYILKNALQD